MNVVDWLSATGGEFGGVFIRGLAAGGFEQQNTVFEQRRKFLRGTMNACKFGKRFFFTSVFGIFEQDFATREAVFKRFAQFGVDKRRINFEVNISGSFQAPG